MKVADLKKKSDKAWQRRRLYDTMLRDVYDYVLPMRDVTGLQSVSGTTEAASRVDKVFDATAPKAAFRFAGRVQTELTPIFQSFFSLEAGPLLPDDDSKKAITEELQRIGAIANGVLASGQYHNSAHEMYVDLYAGTCHMLVTEGEDDDNLIDAIVVPVPEVAIEEGPKGRIERWYWRRKWPAEDLMTMWPDGKFSQTIRDLMEKDGSTEVEVTQYTWYDRKDKNYKLEVWCDKCDDADDPFWTEAFRTCPWITARFFKIPSEPYGRGPAQLAMPFIKTANKTRELQLKAAAFALMGLWAYRNDGVFNPATVKFEPRAMWPVASTGGPMGATLQRLPVPDGFDISGVVMADEREQMKLALFDDTLPSDAGAVRSATEVAERISRLSQDLSGVYGRLTLEIVVPLVRRVIDILERKGVLGKSSLKIDQLLTRVRVIAPIVAGQHAAKVQAVAHWGDTVGMLSQSAEFTKTAKTEILYPDIGRWLGVEEKYIRSELERKKIDEGEKAQQAQLHEAEIAKSMPEAPPMGQQIVNGGIV